MYYLFLLIFFFVVSVHKGITKNLFNEKKNKSGAVEFGSRVLIHREVWNSEVHNVNNGKLVYLFKLSITVCFKALI